MIRLNAISLQFGERFLFDEIGATIGAKERIGLVGSNGAGKSTLLRVLADLEPFDSGQVEKAGYVTIGYLPQDGIAAHGKTLFAEVESAFASVVELRAKVDAASERLLKLDTKSEEYAETLELIGHWEHELEDLDADKLPSRIEAVLHGLGFSQEDLQQRTETFSGGWQMRIALAKLLLATPSLLLLDEPTNHLDLDSQRWLERYLGQYEGSLMIVSHDRAFLDELCQRTFELSRGSLGVYSGNYSFFEKESVARKGQLARSAKNQAKAIEHTEKFIERFRYKASKAKQVQSRIKALDKVERVELESDEDAIAFSFAPAPRSGQTVATIENLRKSYGDTEVIRDASLRIERGDRIAIVGVNGAGKSTLAKVIAGVEPYQSGSLELGHNVIPSYFAQHQADELEPDDSVLEALEKQSEGNTTRNRTILGAFLFHGDDVFKKTRVLSGGERNRLALASMLAQKANFLILDEPTNHLDMRSQAALQRALDNFDGTYLIVSHNRFFVDPVVNKTLEVRHDGLSLFPGNVSDYLRHKEQLEKKAQQPVAKKSAPRSEALNPKERRRRRAQAMEGLTPLKRKSEVLENKIAQLEDKQAALEKKMADPEFFKSAEAAKGMRDYDANKAQLQRHYDDWGQVTDELAARTAELETDLA